MLKQQPPWRLFVITLILTLPVITVTYFSITTAETPKLIKRVFGEVQEPENTTENDEIAQNPQQNAAIKTTTTNRSDDAVKNLNQEVPVQNESLDITPSTYTIEYLHEDAKELPLEAKDLLTVSLDEWDLEKPINNKFLIIDFKIGNGWAIGNIRPDKIQTYTDESFVPPSKGFVLLEEKDSWELAYNGEETTADLLDKIPSEELSNETKQTIFYESYISRSGSTGKTEIQTTGPTTYYLPWPSDEKYSLNYDRLNADETANTGWHGSWPNTNQALDLKPASGSSLEVLTVTDGTITKLCKNTNGNQAYLQITASGTSEVTTIMHLDKTSIPSDLSYASEVSTGDYLGKLYNGSGDERSLNCPMISSGLHLHLGMPSKPVNFDQYTFTSNENGRVQVKDSSGNILDESVSLESTNGSTTPPPPSTTEPTVDEYGIILGESWDKLPPADVTGDGKADLVAFNHDTTDIDITRSQGSYFHSNPNIPTTAAEDGYEVWLDDSRYSTKDWQMLPPADVDNDGDADIIAFNFVTTAIDVSLSNPDTNSFSRPQVWNSETKYSTKDWVLLPPADVNNDNKADIIAFNFITTEVKVSLSSGSSFSSPQLWNTRTFYSTEDWLLLPPADVTGDNRADLIAYNTETHAIKITRSTGTSFHSSEPNGSIASGGDEMWNTGTKYGEDWKLYVADATGDNLADIIAFKSENNQINITRSTGSSFHNLEDNGNIASGGYEVWNTNSKYGDDWILMPPADATGDRRADIIAYNPTTGAIDVTPSTGNSFGHPKYGNESWNTNTKYGSDWKVLEPADVNGDNMEDIVAFNPSTNAVDVTLSTKTDFGGGTAGYQVWNTNTKYGSDWEVLSYLADVTGTKKDDLIAINKSTGKIDVTPSTGSNFGGGYAGYQTWLTQSPYHQTNWEILRPADMNEDGKADFIALNRSTGAIEVSYSTGANFQSPQMILPDSPYKDSNWEIIFSTDVNGDNRADIVAFNTSTLEFQLRLNRGTFLTDVWNSSLDLVYNSGDTILAPNDVTGDGKADLLIHQNNGNNLVVIPSQGDNFGTNYLWPQYWNIETNYPAETYRLLAPSDVNKDGLADLIAFKPSDNSVEVTLSTGYAYGAGLADYEVWNQNCKYR